MNNYVLGTGLVFAYLIYRKVKNDRNIALWYEPAFDNYFIFQVGSLAFEGDVMRYKELMMKEGQANKVEAAIIAGIIAKESKGIANPPPSGRYIGLMQFGLSEARVMGYSGTSAQLLLPASNIKWGTKYLKYCIDKKKDIPRGISGYNTGQVESSNTPFNVDYVNEVASYVPRFRYLLANSFPGYANVFPKETWFSVPGVA